MAFAEGRLALAAIAGVEAHIATCVACQDLLSAAMRAALLSRTGHQTGTSVSPGLGRSAAKEPDAGLLPRGANIGRYTVLEPIGRGGMGQVYAAHDPELDRKVALKLLRATLANADPRAQARLLREAKAIASVSHPNVIAVHDAGTFQDRVFIAMEFVDGPTLKDWLAQRPRELKEILDVFVSAARGLAAAHSAGLVHRDFKLQNVMVAPDGGVRVTDFGLAQRTGDDQTADQAAVIVDPSGSTFDPVAVKLTQTGMLLGTPAYMAPEQFLARPVDARTDQFSFCIALYEALYGERPFASNTLPALKAAVTTGTPNDAPSGTRVPAWIRRVLLRGLQRDPDRRFPSMGALVTALHARSPFLRRRRALVAAAMLMGMAAVALSARRFPSSREPPCRGGTQKLSGVWEPSGARSARKDQIHRAFAVTRKAYAEQAFVGASRLLDAYVGKWLGVYRDTCEATQVRGEQSAEVLDLRMECLQERLNGLQALTDLFVTADANSVENAIPAAGALMSLDDCSDVPRLKAIIRPPGDEVTRRQVDRLRGEQERMVALGDSGHCLEAQTLAEGLLPKIRTTGYLPLIAETAAAAGLLYNNCVPADQAIAWFREAFAAAVESHDDNTAATAATILSPILVARGQSLHEADSWLGIARALINRIGSPSRMEAWWLVSKGTLLLAQRQYGEAISVYRTAMAQKERLLGRNHPDVTLSLMNVPFALQQAGRLDEALTADVSAVEQASRVLGPEHPFVGKILNNEGEVLNLLGRHSEAAAPFRRSLDLLEKAGDDTELLTYPMTGLGISYLGSARWDEAIALLERSLKIRVERRVAPELLGEVRFALARALRSRLADHGRARSLARQARSDYERAGPDLKKVAAIDAWMQATDHRP